MEEAAEKFNLVYVELVWKKKLSKILRNTNDELILHWASSSTFQNFEEVVFLTL